jgi:hypothetical protein
MRESRRLLTAADRVTLAVVAIGIALFVLARLGYILDWKMTTSETERWLIHHEGFTAAHCDHTWTLGLIGRDYRCRVTTSAGGTWSFNASVNGHEVTYHDAP